MKNQEIEEKARELADMVGSVAVDENLPLEVIEMTADILKEDCEQIRQAAVDIAEEERAIRLEYSTDTTERRGSMAGSRTEKHTAVYRNVKRCEFHNIGDYIVVTSIIGGTTFCAFFDSGLHTEESIKRRGSIKLHSIYAKH